MVTILQLAKCLNLAMIADQFYPGASWKIAKVRLIVLFFNKLFFIINISAKVCRAETFIFVCSEIISGLTKGLIMLIRSSDHKYRKTVLLVSPLLWLICQSKTKKFWLWLIDDRIGMIIPLLACFLKLLEYILVFVLN